MPTLPPAGPAGGQMPPAGAFNIPPNIPPQGANGEAPRVSYLLYYLVM